MSGPRKDMQGAPIHSHTTLQILYINTGAGQCAISIALPHVIKFWTQTTPPPAQNPALPAQFKEVSPGMLMNFGGTVTEYK